MTESPHDYCSRELRRFDPDRWLTVLLAPVARRPALVALYAFNAEIARAREAVSQPMIGQIRLQWWREAWAGIRARTPRNHPVVLALHASCAALAPADVEALIDARERDMEDTPPADLAALTEYAEASSAPLMRLAATLLGGALPVKVSRDAGIAYALTGLLRATPYLASQRRVMLPAALLGAHGLLPDDVHQRDDGPALRAAMAEVAAVATAHLEAARRHRVARPLLPAILPAVLAGLHLRALARHNYDAVTAEAAVTALRKQAALLWASLRGRI